MTTDKGFFPIINNEQYEKMKKLTEEDIERRKKSKARADKFAKLVKNNAFK